MKYLFVLFTMLGSIPCFSEQKPDLMSAELKVPSKPTSDACSILSKREDLRAALRKLRYVDLDNAFPVIAWEHQKKAILLAMKEDDLVVKDFHPATETSQAWISVYKDISYVPVPHVTVIQIDGGNSTADKCKIKKANDPEIRAEVLTNYQMSPALTVTILTPGESHRTYRLPTESPNIGLPGNEKFSGANLSDADRKAVDKLVKDHPEDAKKYLRDHPDLIQQLNSKPR